VSIAQGSLRIGDTCVTLESYNGTERLVVWYEPDVVWNAASHSITFHAGGGTFGDPIELHDGDEISIGGQLRVGGYQPSREADDPRHSAWAQPPDASCPEDSSPVMIGEVTVMPRGSSAEVAPARA